MAYEPGKIRNVAVVGHRGVYVALIEALWRVVVSDGRRDPHEDALLRKLAPLIAITDRESAEARRRVTGPAGG